MKVLVTYVGFLLLLTIVGCAPEYYLADDFEAITIDHKTVAILPFEMIFTGRRPKDVSVEEMEKLEINESIIFQRSFYKEVLISLQNGRKPIRVKVQNYKKTLQILEENDIGIKESWYEHGEYLADVLGVDAVVGARIHKNRIMSDFASFSFDMINSAYYVISVFKGWNTSAEFNTTSNEVHADYSLINNGNGEVLWSISYDIAIDWESTPNSIIDKINKGSAKAFPYRIK